MNRFFYTLLFYLALPWVWLRLRARAKQQPAYLEHVGERFGTYPAFAKKPLIWLHAVSLGETRATEPLVFALLAAYPKHALLLTHMTPTGREAGAVLREKCHQKFGEDRVLQAYLPYDLPFAVRKFFAHFAPSIGLLMETELWPNVILQARAHNIPVLLINARLSEKSYRSYARISGLIKKTLNALAGIAAQTEADAGRLKLLGAPSVQVLGNLKFDVAPAPQKIKEGEGFRANFGARQVWLCASTREGEEALILQAYKSLPRQKNRLLLLVPRHPNRFDEVYAQVREAGLVVARRSLGEFPSLETQVWLGDTMGEMPAYFAAADLALMGGTLLPFGGQNLIEAAACGCPVVVGPHSFNFAQATEDAIKEGAARYLADPMALSSTVSHLLDDPIALLTMREAAYRFAKLHKGATERSLVLIEQHLARS